jgi:hypothetical protein
MKSPKMGRPAAFAEEAAELKRRTVSIDDETVRVLAEYGGGVLSVGIRRAARRIAKKKAL